MDVQPCENSSARWSSQSTRTTRHAIHWNRFFPVPNLPPARNRCILTWLVITWKGYVLFSCGIWELNKKSLNQLLCRITESLICPKKPLAWLTERLARIFRCCISITTFTTECKSWKRCTFVHILHYQLKSLNLTFTRCNICNKKLYWISMLLANYLIIIHNGSILHVSKKKTSIHSY